MPVREGARCRGALVVLHVFVTAALAAAAETAPPGWKLVWSDEFEGTRLNTSVWNVRTNESHCCGPFGGNGELELYLPDQVAVRDGQLVISTERKQATGPQGRLWNFTSGWIDTKSRFSQKYGRFEANCSLPPKAARGIWPAFWLMPDSSQCWPTGGEIDIFEFNGNPLVDEIFGSYHWAEPGQCGKDRAPIPGKGVHPPDSTVDWQRAWHVYAVEWTPDRIDFYLDDDLYFSRNASEVDLPSAPMYVIFDQAVDADVFPPTPKSDYSEAQLRVDYVRVYSRGGEG